MKCLYSALTDTQHYTKSSQYWDWLIWYECFPVLGSDLLKLTREDLVQICGAADGIRLYNALKSRYDKKRVMLNIIDVFSYNYERVNWRILFTLCVFMFLYRAVRPRLTVYVSLEVSQSESPLLGKRGHCKNGEHSSPTSIPGM